MPTAPPAEQSPDVNEMRVIHRVFRREFASLPVLIRAVREGDVARAAIVAEHTERILTFLGVHHRGEDELLWPLLTRRLTTGADMVRRMERQHEVVAELLARALQQVAAWADGASAAAGAELASTLEALRGPLLTHLDDEERDMLPLIEAHLSREEWARLGEYGRANAGPPDKLALVLGAILEDATVDEREGMLAPMPAAARERWNAQGAPAYAGYIARVRETG